MAEPAPTTSSPPPPPPSQPQQQQQQPPGAEAGGAPPSPPPGASAAGGSDLRSQLSDTPEQSPDPAKPAANYDTEKLDKVLQSDIGVTVLLTRLKQSIASARDFASFLRKRGVLEDEHAQGLKKLARTVHDSVNRADSKQGTFARTYDEVNKVQDRMSDHGLQFANSLHQMSEELNELVGNMERGRKLWKQNGLAAEKRVQDAETTAEKAKTKYDTLAEQYDRARTGDRAPGKFGLKGPKSAAQHEEELLRKVQQADSDYSSKVQSAQGQRQELLSTLRPQALRALQDLIQETDAALTLQMAKFASFSERVLLGSGLSVSPMKAGPNESGPAFRSLKEAASQVDNEKDFKDYVLSHTSKVGAQPTPVQYERHPTLDSQTGAQNKRQSLNLQISSPAPQPAAQPGQATPSTPAGHPPPGMQRHDQGSVSGGPPGYLPNPVDQQPPPSFQQLSTGRRSPSRERVSPSPQPPGAQSDLPPLNPVFGVSLEDLYQRDGTAIPMIVYQCIQAVELFGLDVEGIYRLSGSASHITHMKAQFDNDSSQVDFTNPENFYHDVNSAAGLLKQFFRDLPDPLFTNARYSDFISAAKRDDDNQRRDALHELINDLPDANYATLRALVLHLNHVQQRSSENRMNAGNIAICFGLTLLGSNAGRNIADSGWQARIIETVLQNTFLIFDDDD